MSEASKFTEQTGFNPFGLNVAGLAGIVSGKPSPAGTTKVVEPAKTGAMTGETTPKWDNAVSRADGDFGPANKGPDMSFGARAPRNEGNLAGGPLENAQKYSGKFKENGPANGVLYRADNRGNVTSYAVYGADGIILKRVDVTGASHGGVPTPHVVVYGRNMLPDGTVRAKEPSTKTRPRPAYVEEIP